MLKKCLFLLFFLFFILSINAQKFISQDTIKITEKKFEKTIVFDYTSLFNWRKADSLTVFCYVDANSLKQYFIENSIEKYEHVFNDTIDLHRFQKKFISFLNNYFEDNDSLIVPKPTVENRYDYKQIMDNYLFAVFYVLRHDYYKLALDKGDVKFYVLEKDFQPDIIIISHSEKIEIEKGRKVISSNFFIGDSLFSIYSIMKIQRLDPDYNTLDSLKPISWKIYTKHIKGDVFRLVFEATLLKHWEIYSVNQPKGKIINPTQFIFENSQEYELIGKINEPKTKSYIDYRFNERVKSFNRSVEFKQDIRLNSDHVMIKGFIIYMFGNIEAIRAPEKQSFIIEIVK